jgi:cell division protein FtsI (penicillin-binding protein 3)
MKPFTIALALEKGLIKPETVIQTAPGHINITGSTITDAHPHGALTVNEVIQKSSNVGTVKIAMQTQPREMWNVHRRRFGTKAPVALPGCGKRSSASCQKWRPVAASHHELWLRHFCQFVSDGAGLTQFLRVTANRLPATLIKNGQIPPGVPVISPEMHKPCGTC